MVLYPKQKITIKMTSSDDENEPDPNCQFKYVFNCTKLTSNQNKSVERGGKLLLPLWVLENIYYSTNTPSPYLFKLTNESNLSYSHAGVLEFTSEENQVCVPPWLMEHLGLKEGDEVTVESVSLPSATYCKLQPLTRNTAYISDTKAVLEENLGNFSCLTEGDVISIYETKNIQIYKLKVVETKPESAVSILNCDINLDLDLPEKVKKESRRTHEKVKTEHKAFPGQGYRLDGNSAEKTTSDNNNDVHQSLKNNKKRKSERVVLDSNNEGQQITDNKHYESTKTNEGEPQTKKHCIKTKDDSSINQLITIREKQKEYAKQKQSSECAKKFPGKGHSLKDK